MNWYIVLFSKLSASQPELSALLCTLAYASLPFQYLFVVMNPLGVYTVDPAVVGLDASPGEYCSAIGLDITPWDIVAISDSLRWHLTISYPTQSSGRLRTSNSIPNGLTIRSSGLFPFLPRA